MVRRFEGLNDLFMSYWIWRLRLNFWSIGADPLRSSLFRYVFLASSKQQPARSESESREFLCFLFFHFYSIHSSSYSSKVFYAFLSLLFFSYIFVDEILLVMLSYCFLLHFTFSVSFLRLFVQFLSLFTLKIFSFWSLSSLRPSPFSRLLSFLVPTSQQQPSSGSSIKTRANTLNTLRFFSHITPIISVEDNVDEERMRRHKNIKFILFTLADLRVCLVCPREICLMDSSRRQQFK